jgi:hypothetical protein
MDRIRPFLHRTRQVLYWLVPAVILFLVFRRINFHRLAFIASRSNPWWVAVGIVYYPLAVMIGSWRWRVLLSGYIGSVPPRFAVKHYWIGLAIGYFMPGSLGWDAYRVAAAGHRYGRYAMNVAVIMVEKLSALICCTAIIVLLSPTVPASGRAGLSGILRFAYLLIAGLILAAAATLMLWRNRDLLHRAESSLAIPLNKLFARFSAGKAKTAAIPLKGMIKPLMSGSRCLIHVLALSLAIQLLGSLADQVFFLAVGYKISIIANLFLGPVLFFIFLLPISFGSLGVREGSYIVLYGLWGVPAEIALLVSFFNLVGVLLNNAAGGLVMLLSSTKTEKRVPAEPKP